MPDPQADYGPNHAKVEELLALLSALTAQQVNVLTDLWREAGVSPSEFWTAAASSSYMTEFALAANAATRQQVQHSVGWSALSQDVRSRATEAAGCLLGYQALSDSADPAIHPFLKELLARSISLPPWWAEVQSRQLFLEMVLAGTSPADACCCVAAL